MRPSLPPPIEVNSSLQAMNGTSNALELERAEKGGREISSALLGFASCLKNIGESSTMIDPKNTVHHYLPEVLTVRGSIMSTDDESPSTTTETGLRSSTGSSDFSVTTTHNNGGRLQRSRERNRIHARKTRQRKKEQMQTLSNRADELKNEQIRLKQSINEKNTASILVGLFACSDGNGSQQVEDPRVEALLRRPAEEIPDAAKLPELPALILPGQHNSKKHQDPSAITMKDDLPDDGIDYDLLGKDRSKCSPAELDKIRRERNRMHAKRTRDRKRLFMEEMADMCQKLHEENDLLQDHLDGLNGRPSKRKELSGSIVSPTLSSSNPELAPTELTMPSRNGTAVGDKKPSQKQASESQHGVTFDQIKTLLEAASTFSSAVSESTNSSFASESISDHEHHHSSKRRRINSSSEAKSSTNVPDSITTTHMSAVVGC